jgi:hypothetical protein
MRKILSFSAAIIMSANLAGIAAAQFTTAILNAVPTVMTGAVVLADDGGGDFCSSTASISDQNGNQTMCQSTTPILD